MSLAPMHPTPCSSPRGVHTSLNSKLELDEMGKGKLFSSEDPTSSRIARPAPLIRLPLSALPLAVSSPDPPCNGMPVHQRCACLEAPKEGEIGAMVYHLPL